MITMDRWGKDHWSTLAYVETRIVDHNGMLCNSHMRCDPKLHPAHAHHPWTDESRDRYKTRLFAGESVSNHDDWSCVEDAESCGLLINTGTGVNPRFELTDLGMMVCNALRNHKAAGGGFGTFQYAAPLTVSHL